MQYSNQLWFDRAKMSIPGGVNSPVRAFGSVGGTPRIMTSARGPHITDADGREYVDLIASWGPMILGHAHPEVVRAVQDAAARGLSFGASTPGETELAELVRERITVGGVAPIEKLRLVSTGTEATMTAIRLARGFTGRDLLVKFAGHYHGHSDALLAEAGSGVLTLSLPGSAGVTAATAAQTIVLPYNDLDAVSALFEERGHEIAAVIIEAAPANMGVVPPDAGFNQALSRLTSAHGALFIIDEVLTGFRVGPAGWWGLEASGTVAGGEGWTPDIITFGKVIGGGLPLAALGGRADVMDYLAPLGPVYQAGTLSGNPVAVAAGLATLRLATPEVYAKLDQVSSVISSAVTEAFSAEGVEHAMQHAGNLFSFAFAPDAPRDYAAVKAQQSWRYPPFFHAMLDAGVYLPPSAFEAWFVNAAMDDAVFEQLEAALPAASRAAASA